MALAAAARRRGEAVWVPMGKVRAQLVTSGGQERGRRRRWRREGEESARWKESKRRKARQGRIVGMTRNEVNKGRERQGKERKVRRRRNVGKPRNEGVLGREDQRGGKESEIRYVRQARNEEVIGREGNE